MKKVFLSILAALMLGACASKPNPIIEQMGRERDTREQARLAAIAEKDRLRMPDGSTYAQKTAQMYGYVAMLLGTCDLLPSTQDAITTQLMTAQVRLKTTTEQKLSRAPQDPTKPWLDVGIRDVEGRAVDCRLVRARTMHWWDWSKQLAEASKYDWDSSRSILATLEKEVGVVLANSPKSR